MNKYILVCDSKVCSDPPETQRQRFSFVVSLSVVLLVWDAALELTGISQSWVLCSKRRAEPVAMMLLCTPPLTCQRFWMRFLTSQLIWSQSLSSIHRREACSRQTLSCCSESVDYSKMINIFWPLFPSEDDPNGNVFKRASHVLYKWTQWAAEVKSTGREIKDHNYITSLKLLFRTSVSSGRYPEGLSSDLHVYIAAGRKSSLISSSTTQTCHQSVCE